MKVLLNNRSLSVRKELSILQLCANNLIDIPRFCYHEQLSIAGNCRMCLVELVGSPKPVVSCTMPVATGMSIKTTTSLVRKARESVMELLLVNHPLDCPICDQGGECDLQDQALLFGNDRGRFYEGKRSVSYKNFGSLIKAIMTRCIHCTRCVRFLESVTSSASFGVTGRGNSMEIGSYVAKNLSTELSGNLIDLCPVGALTAKVSSFRARSWELSNIPSVDVMDSYGSAVSLCVRGDLLYRVLPELLHLLDEAWITDKIRFSFDGLSLQRLSSPFLRLASSSMLVPVTWDQSFSFFLRKSLVVSSSFLGLVGSLTSLEAIYLFKHLLLRKGHSSFLSQEFSTQFDINNFTAQTSLSSKNMAKLKELSSCFLVGVNLRFESPILLTKLRFLFSKTKYSIFTLGCPLAYGVTFPTYNIGNSTQTLLSLFEGTHKASPSLLGVKPSLMFVSLSGLSLSFYSFLSKAVLSFSSFSQKLSKAPLYLVPLFTGSNVFGLLDLGTFGSNESHSSLQRTVVYSLGSDEVRLKRSNSSNFLKVYQGHHGDYFAGTSDVLFPGSTFTEISGLFTNYLGLTRQTAKVPSKSVFSSASDWTILNSLYLYLFEFKLLKLDSYKDLRLQLKTMLNFSLDFKLSKGLQQETLTICSKFTFSSYISDYYATNVVARASKTMFECSRTSKGVFTTFKTLS